MDKVAAELQGLRQDVSMIGDQLKDLRAKRREETNPGKREELQYEINHLTTAQAKLNGWRDHLQKALQSVQGTRPLAITKHQ